MKNQILIKIISALINIIVCFIGILICFSPQYWFDWFNYSIIPSILFCSASITISLAIFGNKILALFQSFPFLVRIVLAGILGMLLAYLWLTVVELILFDFDVKSNFPIVYLWMLGNASQLIFLTKFGNFEKIIKKNLNFAISIFGYLIFSIVIIPVGLVVLSNFIKAAVLYIDRPEAELFLIPKGYTGYVYIIHDDIYGEPKEYENDIRVYHVPSSGIFFTKFEYESGLTNEEYYYVDSLGSRTKIPNGLDGPADSVFAIYGGGKGGRSESPTNHFYKYTYKFLGTVQQYKDAEEVKISYFDSLYQLQINKTK